LWEKYKKDIKTRKKIEGIWQQNALKKNI